MRKPLSMLRACALGLASLACLPTLAIERAPAPHRVPAAATDQARVIVSYKAQAGVLRDLPLARHASGAEVAKVMQGRADSLTRSARVPLVAGRALSDRMQVLKAGGLSSAELARRLSADPDVAYAVVDGRQRVLMVPNDPLYLSGPPVNPAFRSGGPAAGQWYLRAPVGEVRSSINATAAWDLIPRAGADVVVAVLDTGVRTDHLDLRDRLLPGYDFIRDVPTANDGNARDTDASDPGDWITAAENARGGAFANCGEENSSWHGTKVAGIIGAATNNNIGMAGIAFGALIRPVRVLGKCGGFDSDIIAGMLWAAGIDQPELPGSSPRAQVLNMSLGSEGACSAAYRDAVAQVNARGSVIVAAAGNSAGRAVGTPANCPGMIAVAGLRHAGSKVGFSDLGPEISIAAPGGNCINISAGSACLYPIVTATNAGSQAPLAGSSAYTDSFDISVGISFAAPIVAGTAALVLGAQPSLNPTEVRNLLRATARAFPTSGADNGPDDPTPVTTCTAPGSVDQLQCYCTTGLCGAGMVDAAAAAAAAVQGVFVRVGWSPTEPQATGTLQLSSNGTLLGTGRTAVAWTWTLVSSGGIVSGFSSGTNAATANLVPTAAGSLTVRLTVTDDLGRSASGDATIAVTAAPVPPPSTGGGASSGGGGTSSLSWLLALLAAAGLLRVSRQRQTAPD